mgnify:FL=1
MNSSNYKTNVNESINYIYEVLNKNSLIFTKTNISRRLYDVLIVLSSSGIVIHNRKEIYIPLQVLTNFKGYYQEVDKYKLKKKSKI